MPLPSRAWSQRATLPLAALVGLLLLLLLCPGPGVSKANKFRLMLQKREAPVLMKEEMSVKEDKAKEFLNNLKRQKRQLWDRSQPDVQQWYQHFLYLGFDEAKFEDYVSYWSNLGRDGHEYDGGYYHHHYDEDAPIGPRNPDTFRHGANVNYDDYY
ncbi:augurin [Pantherophis guttatus]|uniref:Augurin n=1 Tax=Pantherophis guttatus TaxID=94885 RepID=A0A6P9C7B5_PANGU|nr:augurin [Pantherophis guttatus]XP_034275481.1 augurin [Pantherophis guttatus]